MTLDDVEQVLGKAIGLALDEDLGITGDITTQGVFPAKKDVVASIITRDAGVIAGMFVAAATFKLVDDNTGFVALCEDGVDVEGGQTIAQVKGDVSAVLSAERVALNFLSHMSGIATMTRRFVDKAAPYGVTIKDTRKTLPGLRIFEKYAVEAGGGIHHRFGLYDAVLIKDNHIKAAGGMTEAVTRVRGNLQGDLPIEIEASTIDEVKEALRAGVDTIMLDNMDVEMIRKAVKMIDGSALVEVSGNIVLDNVEEIAKTGVNYISVGALTHSSKALSLSLLIE
jgi:nicotinate-nucleotide pyrophosphorylase (carboxylating)